MAVEPLRLSLSRLLLSLATLILVMATPATAETFTYPYLRDVRADSVEIAWVSSESTPVTLHFQGDDLASTVTPAPELSFHPTEVAEFSPPEIPRFLHTVTLEGLPGGKDLDYTVRLPEGDFQDSFRLSLPDQKVRLIAYADSETEPESTGTPVNWASEAEPKRTYLIDQTTGYAVNLKEITSSRPDAILIAGDLVESGGEQRDWDEFWRHNQSVAGRFPLLPAPGNHEYYAGPKHGGYDSQASRNAIAKYRTYFPHRYYSKDIGPATVISLDCTDGLPHGSDEDSNHHLEAAGDFAPGFHQTSEQVRWLKSELQRTQAQNRFTIVLFHHCPYSSGVHGFEPGKGEELDPQSGQPVRLLTPLFMQYGVEMLVNGHDEMMERSEVEGEERTLDGKNRKHTLQVYDVGIAGDGLRGPRRENEWRKFLAAVDAPEVWEEGVLVSGGRHYGHLQIDVEPTESGWKATMTPVYLLPTIVDGKWTFQRKLYPDIVEITSR